ncbi:MAG: hypothetical protein GVY10_04160 [Verrucomicrobia bacterium]|jgi:nitrogen fixation NifU-like protein|nr:hypothetical protein [Verrucomicrobiota bacterium]
MTGPASIYDELLLRHHRDPCGYGIPDTCTHFANGRNPRCGDEVTVALRIEEERIVEAAFEAQACAVTRSSSSLMVQCIRNIPVTEARETARAIEALFNSTGEVSADFLKGEMIAFNRLRDHSGRKDCVLLPWRGLLNALPER